MIFYSKQFQNQGIGSEFLQVIENQNIAVCCKATLDVYRSNSNAVITYEKK